MLQNLPLLTQALATRLYFMIKYLLGWKKIVGILKLFGRIATTFIRVLDSGVNPNRRISLGGLDAVYSGSLLFKWYEQPWRPDSKAVPKTWMVQALKSYACVVVLVSTNKTFHQRNPCTKPAVERLTLQIQEKSRNSFYYPARRITLSTQTAPRTRSEYKFLCKYAVNSVT